jgi:hypothetical protein
MCLERLDSSLEELHYFRLKIGYKRFCIRASGVIEYEYCSHFGQNTVKVDCWLESEAESSWVHAADGSPYSAGFHVYLSKPPLSVGEAIVLVHWDGPIVTGWQEDVQLPLPVVVARKMYVPSSYGKCPYPECRVDHTLYTLISEPWSSKNLP